jgi:hypothetical protein
MESAASRSDLQRLERKVDDGSGDVAAYLSLLRKFKLRRPEKVVVHGSSLLKDSASRRKLGSEGSIWASYLSLTSGRFKFLPWKIIDLDEKFYSFLKNALDVLFLSKFRLWKLSKCLFQQASSSCLLYMLLSVFRSQS